MPLRLLGLRPKALGDWGERLAARHLKKQKYRVLARNARSKMGEIDIVALAPDGRTLVIVEVKTRKAPAVRTPHTPRPEDALTRDKRQRLLRLAQLEAKQRGMTTSPLRIDVIAIERPERGNHILRHHVNAITPGR